MNGSHDFDVVIVGTGPAGGAAAMELAGSGLRVGLIEKEMLPRYKTCGGGVLARAVKLLGVDISPAVQHQCFAVGLNLNRKMQYTVERSVPIVSMVMRQEFDQLLAQHAVDRGVELMTDCEVTAVRIESEHVTLETSRGELTARFVIAADGAKRRIGKLARFPDDRFLGPAEEWEVFVDTATYQRFANEARFDFDAIPFGYGWVFPKREHLSIGVGTFQRGGGLKQHLQKYMESLGIVPKRVEAHGFVIPLLGKKDLAASVFARDRILMCGDAAGLADPVTGEGITFAISSGKIAARAIRAGFPDAQAVEEKYVEGLQKEILPELRIGARLANLLYFRPRMRNGLFRIVGQRLPEKMTEIVMGETNYAEVVERFRGEW